MHNDKRHSRKSGDSVWRVASAFRPTDSFCDYFINNMWYCHYYFRVILQLTDSWILHVIISAVHPRSLFSVLHPAYKSANPTIHHLWQRSITNHTTRVTNAAQFGVFCSHLNWFWAKQTTIGSHELISMIHSTPIDIWFVDISKAKYGIWHNIMTLCQSYYFLAAHSDDHIHALMPFHAMPYCHIISVLHYQIYKSRNQSGSELCHWYSSIYYNGHFSSIWISKQTTAATSPS